jgi:8-oxo-dGTP diphosphatase
MRKGMDYTGVGVVFFCHDGEGNFLMSKRSNACRDEYERWDIGAGALEFGHTIEDTLQREIKEEYCSRVIDYEFLGFRDVHREHNGQKTHWVALDFKVQIDRRIVMNGEPHKFDEIAWYTIDSLPEPLHTQLPTFLTLYQNKL